MTAVSSGTRGAKYYPVFLVVIVILLILVLEGGASFILNVADRREPGREFEEPHTEYDPEIGWISKASILIPDAYGSGISIRTNSQRFRKDTDYPRPVPAGKFRILCSGDSYTFGHGVSNEDVWTELAGGIDDRLELVNMGQAGYGIDQAFLWFTRNRDLLEYDMHLLSVITPDFQRVGLEVFSGHPKPILELKDGKIVAGNVPIGHPSRIRKIMENLAVTRLVHGWIRGNRSSAGRISEKRVEKLVSAMLRQLAERERERGKQFAVAYLPTSRSALDSKSDKWRAFIAREARAGGWLFFDLVDDFSALEYTKTRDLFHVVHYSEAGNRWVAENLCERLGFLPEVSRLTLPDRDSPSR